MSAEISKCGRYRYLLCRENLPFQGRAYEYGRRMIFVMLNPSTADATIDDPTIRRCIGFACREACSTLYVVNLYALRSPSPKELWGAEDPVGPKNDDWLQVAMQISGIVVCAWGANARQDRVDRFLDIAGDAGKKLWCLGTTKDGAPRHPLYVKRVQPLIPFNATEPSP